MTDADLLRMLLDNLNEGYGDRDPFSERAAIPDEQLAEMGYCPVCGLLGQCTFESNGRAHNADI